MKRDSGIQVTRALLIGLAMTGFVLGGAERASAHEEHPWGQDRGWSLGLDFVLDFIGAEDPGPESSPDAIYVNETGGGLAFHLGYAFTPVFGLRLTAIGAGHETTRDGISVSNASVTLEALVRFLHGKRFQPYALGGLGGATLQFNNEVLDTRTSGGTAVVGGGVQYHLSRHLALDLAGRLDLINWDKVEVTATLPDGSKAQLENPVDESGSAAKLMLGLVWNF
jgi:opacity protein-like surface antigen